MSATPEMITRLIDAVYREIRGECGLLIDERQAAAILEYTLEPALTVALQHVEPVLAAADTYVAERGIEHSGGIVEAAFEAGALWASGLALSTPAMAVVPVVKPGPGLWRVFEDATGRGRYWGIEKASAADDDDVILPPIRVMRETLEPVVAAHNAALAATPAPAIVNGTITETMVNAAWNAGKHRHMTGLPSDFRAVIEAALAAAQADYEQRIRSALVAASPAPAVVDGLVLVPVELLKRIWAEMYYGVGGENGINDAIAQWNLDEVVDILASAGALPNLDAPTFPGLEIKQAWVGLVSELRSALKEYVCECRGQCLAEVNGGFCGRAAYAALKKLDAASPASDLKAENERLKAEIAQIEKEDQLFCERTNAEIERLRDVLSGLSSYLGAGLGDEGTTPDQFNDRIRWGISHMQEATIHLCAETVERLSRRPQTTWGEVKAEIIALSAPATAAEVLPTALQQKLDKVTEALNASKSHATHLERAIKEEDPKPELLLRIGDVLKEVRAALQEVRDNG